MSDTIFALASAKGRSGVAVVRISGSRARLCLEILTGSCPEPRRASLRKLHDTAGDVLDQALVLFFTDKASFTGEDVAELHLHGSPATVAVVLQTLSGIEGLRLADPGEFTRRALENGQLDLAQVEGLGDLVQAETEAQRRQALRIFEGALGVASAAWRADLVHAAALLEATIDFADEDVPVDVTPEVLTLIDRVEKDLAREIKGSKAAERIRDGFEVAIIGAPNSGKSTLLNALAGREAAITSEIAGTTRDVIEVRMDLRGLAVTILDTAGLRETSDHVEGLGIRLAEKRASKADLRVFLDENPKALSVDIQAGDIFRRPKGDLFDGDSRTAVSGKTGFGVDELIDEIALNLENRASGVGVAIKERHRVSLSAATEAIEIARKEVILGADRAEFAAEELRSAIRALAALIGDVDIELILDDIFANFCLGK